MERPKTQSHTGGLYSSFVLLTHIPDRAAKFPLGSVGNLPSPVGPFQSCSMGERWEGKDVCGGRASVPTHWFHL